MSAIKRLIHPHAAAAVVLTSYVFALRLHLLQVVVTATDPSAAQHSAYDTDLVSFGRHLELDLQKSGSYLEGDDGVDSINYLFEASWS